jgi:tRNA-specific 2-thiouridylase
MIKEYQQGKTPNPDVMCNKEIKFGVFFRRALAEGAHYVATGHYARVVFDKKTETYGLYAGVDSKKDQSYFLWTLAQAQLEKTLFPVGKFKKPYVRALAKKFGLLTAEKKDSQGLCFMGQLDMKDFLAHFMEKKEGLVLTDEGVEIGKHRGAYFYTLGERHGFVVSQKTASNEPYYVIAKDLALNTITVAHKIPHQHFTSATKEVFLSHINFCRGIFSGSKQKYVARIRYHGEPYAVFAQKMANARMKLVFRKPILAASGQSIVLYKGNECVGGGVMQ